jgi:hypothetical protein
MQSNGRTQEGGYAEAWGCDRLRRRSLAAGRMTSGGTMQGCTGTAQRVGPRAAGPPLNAGLLSKHAWVEGCAAFVAPAVTALSDCPPPAALQDVRSYFHADFDLLQIPGRDVQGAGAGGAAVEANAVAAQGGKAARAATGSMEVKLAPLT